MIPNNTCKECGKLLVLKEEKEIILCLACSTCSCGNDLRTNEEIRTGVCTDCRKGYSEL